MAACSGCATENPDAARFCMRCGASLVPSAPVREQRKTVTVVFADVTGSTGLGERLDPESLRSIMGRWFEAMRMVLERHGGTVEKFIGDAVVAASSQRKLRPSLAGATDSAIRDTSLGTRGRIPAARGP